MFRKPHGVMCKQNKLEGLIPVIRKNECWQPESSEVGYNRILIKGLVQNVQLEPLKVYTEEIYWKTKCYFSWI